MSDESKVIRATARVNVVLEVTIDDEWDASFAVGKIHEDAVDKLKQVIYAGVPAAESKFIKYVQQGRVRIVGKPTVTTVLVTEET